MPLTQEELQALRWLIKKGPSNHMYASDLRTANAKIVAELKKMKEP
jgi:hypothetical protein